MSTFLRKPIRTRRAAMIFAINYTGTESALRGCINDGKRTLAHVAHYEHAEMLTDETPLKPTRANILAKLEKLAAMSRIDDPFTHFVIHYSGHGTSIKDLNGDEDDKKDEAWYAIDNKLVVDDEIRAILDKFSPWATVMIIVDACHSGTACDLPLTYTSSDGRVEIEHSTAPVCNVLMISGCKDTQTSADVVLESDRAAGAMTDALYTSLDAKNGCNLTVFELREQMHKYMIENGHDQRPQITTSRPLKDATKITEFFSFGTDTLSSRTRSFELFEPVEPVENMEKPMAKKAKDQKAKQTKHKPGKKTKMIAKKPQRVLVSRKI